MYDATSVDEAIAELKAENERLVKDNERIKRLNEIVHNELVSRKWVDYNRRITLRALWIARSKCALEKIAWFKLWNTSISTMNPEDGARQEFDKWKKNLGKFLKKAEEYR